jgi:NOL1/NOP2/fmu family ribosome biogenesis protein
VIQAGSALGEIMKNKIVPDHALALSVSRNKDAFPVLTLDRTQALAYLRKESTLPPAATTGFHLVEFEGLGLGWMNVLPNRMNNLYPAGRRIRMTD